MNPFLILGIPNNSTIEIAQKAYRKLAMKFHPDRNSSVDATEKFKQIKAAWEMIQSGFKIEVHKPNIQQKQKQKWSQPEYTGWQSKPDIPPMYQKASKNSFRNVPKKDIFEDLKESVIGAQQFSMPSTKPWLLTPEKQKQPLHITEKFYGEFTAGITEQDQGDGYRVEIAVNGQHYIISVEPNTPLNLPKQFKIADGYVTIVPTLIN